MYQHRSTRFARRPDGGHPRRAGHHRLRGDASPTVGSTTDDGVLHQRGLRRSMAATVRSRVARRPTADHDHAHHALSVVPTSSVLQFGQSCAGQNASEHATEHVEHLPSVADSQRAVFIAGRRLPSPRATSATSASASPPASRCPRSRTPASPGALIGLEVRVDLQDGMRSSSATNRFTPDLDDVAPFHGSGGDVRGVLDLALLEARLDRRDHAAQRVDPRDDASASVSTSSVSASTKY